MNDIATIDTLKNDSQRTVVRESYGKIASKTEAAAAHLAAAAASTPWLTVSVVILTTPKPFPKVRISASAVATRFGDISNEFAADEN